MLAMQKICLLCPRLFCVVLHCELELRDQGRGVNMIMSHFTCKRTELASMLDDIFFKGLLAAPVPPACTRIRSTLLTAELRNLYGPGVATALQTPPVVSASLATDSAATRASSPCLEKLNRTDQQTTVFVNLRRALDIQQALVRS
ncbi:uncharacterized protein BJ212DRAFT_1301667 [Suillus subaureus]|uniref:Uncharacterized protein n=1 Tax=Suillus subaureus TaxID=48587 RepID=A0A9P7E6G3_9AGAM|nr:uncharacterized protein BJ212DRAFT_1301667 [Suillus subaureus]KAG1812145.1 hypothetical protein BJ212DRAFT_1301667 [Suillus subaureus]